MRFRTQEGGKTRFEDPREILNEIQTVWNRIDTIEKAAKEILDENSPILESIGFAWIHMMNSYHEIEESLGPRPPNKLEPMTLAQIIDVLTRIKWAGPKNTKELVDAYRTAVKAVADFNDTHRNTIADACTRRLQLDRDGFLGQVDMWLSGQLTDLRRCLKTHCRKPEQRLIDDFFDENGSFRERY